MPTLLSWTSTSSTSTWSPSSCGATSRPTTCPPRSARPLRPPRRRSRAPTTSSTARASAGWRPSQLDIDIPLKYGVDQCVGDTLCAGGIMYGQRNIPQILDFCKDIREVAAAGRALPQLRQPQRHEHLGRQPVRRGAHHRPVPRRAGRALQIAEVIELLVNEGKKPGDPGYSQGHHQGRRHHLRRHQPPDLVHPGASTRARTGPAGCWKASRSTRSTARPRRCASTCCAASATTPPSPTATSPSTCPGTASARTRSTSWIDLSSWINGETGGYLRVCTRGPQLVRDRLPQAG